MDDVLTLINQTYVKNDRNRFVESEERREVFCDVLSITRSEYFNAGRSGLNPEYEFRIFKGDYNGEKLLIYKDHPYSIYRVFLPSDEDYIELYVERKGGTNGKGADIVQEPGQGN